MLKIQSRSILTDETSGSHETGRGNPRNKNIFDIAFVCRDLKKES